MKMHHAPLTLLGLLVIRRYVMARPQTFDNEQMLVAAYDVLRTEGPSGTSLRAIGRRLGVSEPAVLRRLGSKKELWVELLHWATQRTTELVSMLDGMEPHDGLRRLCCFLAQQGGSSTSVVNLLAFTATCLADERLRAHVTERNAALIRGVTGALRRAEYKRADELASALVALFDGVTLAWAMRPRQSLERELLHALELLLEKEEPWAMQSKTRSWSVTPSLASGPNDATKT